MGFRRSSVRIAPPRPLTHTRNRPSGIAGGPFDWRLHLIGEGSAWIVPRGEDRRDQAGSEGSRAGFATCLPSHRVMGTRAVAVDNKRVDVRPDSRASAPVPSPSPSEAIRSGRHRHREVVRVGRARLEMRVHRRCPADAAEQAVESTAPPRQVPVGQHDQQDGRRERKREHDDQDENCQDPFERHVQLRGTSSLGNMIRQPRAARPSGLGRADAACVPSSTTSGISGIERRALALWSRPDHRALSGCNAVPARSRSADRRPRRRYGD